MAQPPPHVSVIRIGPCASDATGRRSAVAAAAAIQLRTALVRHFQRETMRDGSRPSNAATTGGTAAAAAAGECVGVPDPTANQNQPTATTTEPPGGPSSSGPLVQQHHHANDGLVLLLSNKYFTAPVLLAEIGADLNPSQSCTVPKTTEDGILLVFDDDDFAITGETTTTVGSSSLSSSFDGLLHQVHEQALALHASGDLLRLCVSLTSSVDADTDGANVDSTLVVLRREKEYARRVLWCLDRGYEYVQADVSSDEALRQGHDARDKDGFARIVEAIAGTVWSSAEMIPRVQQQLQETYHRDATSMQTDNDATTTTNNNSCTANSDDVGTYEPPDPSVLFASPDDENNTSTLLHSNNKLCDDESDWHREKLAREALFADASVAETAAAVDDASAGSSQTKEPAAGPALSQPRVDKDSEQAFSAFESTLQGARRIRELSLTGALTDDDRRKRAGDAAVLLMNMMGNMGWDEGDSSDEDDRHHEPDDDKAEYSTVTK